MYRFQCGANGHAHRANWVREGPAKPVCRRGIITRPTTPAPLETKTLPVSAASPWPGALIIARPHGIEARPRGTLRRSDFIPPKMLMLRPKTLDANKAGFAAVDALVAVTVLAFSLSLSLVAAEVTARAARASVYTRSAELLLSDRIHRFDGEPRSSSGAAAGLAWRLEVAPIASSAGKLSPCALTASAKAPSSDRRYEMSTFTVCSASVRQ